MAESSGDGFETTYPAMCEGVCHLGPQALRLVNGVLGANCSGPRMFSDETLVLVESNEDGASITPTVPSDKDKLACTNPRLVRAMQAKVHKNVEDLLIKTVEMER